MIMKINQIILKEGVRLEGSIVIPSSEIRLT
jgi:hypothetical protein